MQTQNLLTGVQADMLVKASQGLDVREASTSSLSPSLVQAVYDVQHQEVERDPSRCCPALSMVWLLRTIAVISQYALGVRSNQTLFWRVSCKFSGLF